MTRRAGSADSPFAARLLAWFDAHRRDLPWRKTSDPWAIWVSEVMLQQTRVEAVRDAWSRFLQRYPRPADFATAGDDELQAAWRGLGYYRRARLLREGARQCLAVHGGAVPAEVAQLGALPGIGDYTRGAIASIAFGQREVAIDGNVDRVLARHRGLSNCVRAAATRKAIREQVAAWQPAARPGDFNQALMELGAVICTPKRAECDRCPVAADCVAQNQGRQLLLPVLPPRPAPVDVQARAIVAFAGPAVLGHRLPEGGINGGQIDLPGPGALVDCAIGDLTPALQQRFGCAAEVQSAVAVIRHAITRHRITLHVHPAIVRRRGRLQPFAPHDPDVPWTTTARKAFSRLALPGAGSAAEDR
ncbi:MAG: A/G-specific adenine glycosylase [Planctomycetes bacterium]|nr:A/G-specific adenine glycosylase [Planctomycetota bacterium]